MYRCGLDLNSGVVAAFIILLLINFDTQADSPLIAVSKSGQEAGSVVDPKQTTPLESDPTESGLSSRIVGGSTTRRNEFPEFVQLFVDGAVIGLDPNYVYSWCGGTLLSSNKALTAAHCTFGIGAGSLYALPEFYSFSDNINFSDLIPLLAKREHPQYAQQTVYDYDVSVLTLARPSSTRKAKILAGNLPLAGQIATVIGTGALSEGGQGPATLQKVSIPIVSNSICQAAYGFSAITDAMICAGLSNGGKDSCQGDSGGPLWINQTDENIQVGIVSWGNGCARPGFYGVYARTSAMTAFIRQQAPQTQIVELNQATPINLIPMLDVLLFDNSPF